MEERNDSTAGRGAGNTPRAGTHAGAHGGARAGAHTVVGRARLERLRARCRHLDDLDLAAAGEPCASGSCSGAGGRELVSGLRGAAGGLAGVEWPRLAGAEQLGFVEELELVRRQVDLALAEGLAAVDRLGTAEVASGLGTAAWFAHRSGGSAAEGARRLRVGRLLGHFPVMRAAIAGGELSVEHAKVLVGLHTARVHDQLVVLDATLVQAALVVSFREWERDMRQLVALLDADGAEPALDRNRVNWQPHGGGGFLRGELVGMDAELFAQALAAETDRQRRAAWAEHDAAGVAMPGAAQLRARALVELVRRGTAAGPTGSDGSDGSAAPRVEAVVVIDADDEGLRGVRGLEGDPIDPATAAVLACGAWFQALVTDAAGMPLWLGRSRRLASPAQRRALAVRDGGCVFPGCEAPVSWCDAHHVQGWHHGGATDVHNLVLLCRRHHGLAHSATWTLRPATTPPGSPPGPAFEAQAYEWIHNRTGAVHPAHHRRHIPRGPTERGPTERGPTERGPNERGPT